jgi:hypothetical protein
VRLSSASSLAQRFVAAACHGAFEVLVLERRSLDWQRLESRGLGESLGAPRFLFMGLAKRSWPEIVVHISRNSGGGETPLTEPSSGRLGFKLGRIRFDSLKLG